MLILYASHSNQTKRLENKRVAELFMQQSPVDASELENVLLMEAVIRAVATHLQDSKIGQDAEQSISEVKKMVLTELANHKELLVSRIAAARIEASFTRQFNSRVKTKNELLGAVDNLFRATDVEATYSQVDAEISIIIQNNDYDGALRYYNNKGLLGKAGGCFGLSAHMFLNITKRLIVDQLSQDVRKAVQHSMPSINYTPPVGS